jgi:hypothetical protein
VVRISRRICSGRRVPQPRQKIRSREKDVSKDGPHATEGEAASVFEAARVLISQGWRYWWWTDADIIVRAGGRELRVKQERVKEWVKSRRGLI